MSFTSVLSGLKATQATAVATLKGAADTKLNELKGKLAVVDETVGKLYSLENQVISQLSGAIAGAQTAMSGSPVGQAVAAADSAIATAKAAAAAAAANAQAGIAGAVSSIDKMASTAAAAAASASASASAAGAELTAGIAARLEIPGIPSAAAAGAYFNTLQVAVAAHVHAVENSLTKMDQIHTGLINEVSKTVDKLGTDVTSQIKSMTDNYTAAISAVTDGISADLDAQSASIASILNKLQLAGITGF